MKTVWISIICSYTLQTRRLERKKEAVGDSALDRTQKRKLERDEERLKSTNRYTSSSMELYNERRSVPVLVDEIPLYIYR